MINLEDNDIHVLSNEEIKTQIKFNKECKQEKFKKEIVKNDVVEIDFYQDVTPTVQVVDKIDKKKIEIQPNISSKDPKIEVLLKKETEKSKDNTIKKQSKITDFFKKKN